MLSSSCSDSAGPSSDVLPDHVLMKPSRTYGSVLLSADLCILFYTFPEMENVRIRVPHCLIQNSYIMLSSKLRILIRTFLVLTISSFLMMTKTYRIDMNLYLEYQMKKTIHGFSIKHINQSV